MQWIPSILIWHIMSCPSFQEKFHNIFVAVHCGDMQWCCVQKSFFKIYVQPTSGEERRDLFNIVVGGSMPKSILVIWYFLMKTLILPFNGMPLMRVVCARHHWRLDMSWMTRSLRRIISSPDYEEHFLCTIWQRHKVPYFVPRPWPQRKGKERLLAICCCGNSCCHWIQITQI